MLVVCCLFDKECMCLVLVSFKSAQLHKLKYISIMKLKMMQAQRTNESKLVCVCACFELSVSALNVCVCVPVGFWLAGAVAAVVERTDEERWDQAEGH